MNKMQIVLLTVLILSISALTLQFKDATDCMQQQKQAEPSASHFQYINITDTQTGKIKVMQPMISTWCIETQKAAVKLFGLQFCAF